MSTPSAPSAALDTSSPTPAASPRRLALSAFLHGGPRGPLEALRVLEIGCRDGANLLPLAFYDPGSSHVGLDPDPARIDAARAAAAEVGLTNVRFEVLDPAAIPDTIGPFDCVLVRDCFARAEQAARDTILRSCRSQLAPGGLVYLDYPVAPGAQVRSLVRDLVLPLAGEDAGRVKEAAASLRGLITAAEHPYPALLSMELDRLAGAPLDVIRSDYLQGERAVFRHRDVVELAAARGLRFVCDADFNGPEGYAPDEARAELARRGFSGVDLDQALDVLLYRRERASVFCRDDAPRLEAPGPEALDDLQIASPLAADRPVRLDPGVEEAFVGPLGQRIGSADPLFKAALIVLAGAYPRPLSFADLVGRAVERLHGDGAEGEPSDPQIAGLARDLWVLHRRGLVELTLTPPRLPGTPGRALHALARLEARSRSQSKIALTTPLHTVLELGGFEALMVRHLHEGADHDALVGALVDRIAAGELALELGGSRLTDPVLLEPMVRGLLDRGLAKLGRWGLLEPSPDRA